MKHINTLLAISALAMPISSMAMPTINPEANSQTLVGKHHDHLKYTTVNIYVVNKTNHKIKLQGDGNPADGNLWVQGSPSYNRQALGGVLGGNPLTIAASDTAKHYAFQMKSKDDHNKGDVKGGFQILSQDTSEQVVSTFNYYANIFPNQSFISLPSSKGGLSFQLTPSATKESGGLQNVCTWNDDDQTRTYNCIFTINMAPSQVKAATDNHKQKANSISGQALGNTAHTISGNLLKTN